MEEAFASLGHDLQQRLAGGRAFYLANPGNWGDALIRQGALQFFRDFALDVREFRSVPELMAEAGGASTVIFGGGGAWCRLWNHAELAVTMLKQRFHVVVLPSTYEMAYAIPNTTFFCRDRYESQSNVRSARFCHDMAFYLQQRIGSGLAGQGRGAFFRTDAESARRRPIPSDNQDISLRGDHMADIGGFVRAIEPYAEIHTDRLHVAILGCLLDRNVHLYPNSYFKNRAVYLSSFREHYRNVTFVEPNFKGILA